MSIVKTYKFNSLSKAIIIYIKALHSPHKEAVDLIYSLIEFPNLSKVSKVLKKNSKFKTFAIKYVQDIIKNKINVVVNNLKLSMSISKINLDTIKRFSISTINNEYTKSISILQSLLRALADSIVVLYYSSC